MTNSPSSSQYSGRIASTWSIAQVCSVTAAIIVTILLIVRPQIGLYVTWDLLIPLVPATLLIAPRLWRNLCPVAVVNQLPQRFGLRNRKLPSLSAGVATTIALLLFLLIVPLRLVVFNEDGPALALFVVLVLLAALAGGLLFVGKAGWCASICPVLPVERLYGQLPVLSPGHAHCETCSGCVKSCYDLIPERAIVRLTDVTTTDSGRRPNFSTGTPTGIFAAAFPGFVFGYFTVGHDASLGETYGWIVLWSAVSWLIGTGATYLTGTVRPMLRTSAALAAVLYYWFSVPAIAAQTRIVFHTAPIPTVAINALRSIFGTMIAVWIVQTVRHDRMERSTF